MEELGVAIDASESLVGVTEPGACEGNVLPKSDDGKRDADLGQLTEEAGQTVEEEKRDESRVAKAADPTVEMAEEEEGKSRVLEEAVQKGETVDEEEDESRVAKEASEEVRSGSRVKRRRFLVELEEGRLAYVKGAIAVQKYQLLRNSDETIQSPGTRLDVTCRLPIGNDLEMEMIGYVWIRSGRVTVDARRMLRRRKLILHHRRLMVNTDTKVMVGGKLMVQRDVVIREELYQMVRVAGKLMVRPGQFVCVTPYPSNMIGRLCIKPGQVLNVKGEMWPVRVYYTCRNWIRELTVTDGKLVSIEDEEEEKQNNDFGEVEEGPKVTEADLKNVSEMELVAGEKHDVFGYVCMPLEQTVLNPGDSILTPGSRVIVNTMVNTDIPLFVTMSGIVQVRSGEVRTDSHRFARRGRLLKNYKHLVVNGNQILRMRGELAVRENTSVGMGSNRILQVEGRLAVVENQTLYLSRRPTVGGLVKLKPDQVVYVEGEVHAKLMRRMYGTIKYYKSHEEIKISEDGSASTSSSEDSTSSSTSDDEESLMDAEEEEEEEAEEEEEEGKEDDDVDVRVKCPLSKITDISCTRVCRHKNLLKHLTGAHSDILRIGPTFHTRYLNENVLLILFRGEVFLYQKRIDDNLGLSTILQSLGITDNKFEYEVTIRGGHSHEGIRANITLKAKVEPNDDASPQRKTWMFIPQNTWKIFMTNDELDMVVSVREIGTLDFFHAATY